MSNPPDMPPLPPIPELTQLQINRLITADWLEQIAKMVRTGAVSGFDVAWDTRYNKPLGSVQIGTTELRGPAEVKFRAQMAEEARKMAEVIPVQDISEDILDHSCESEECLVCNNSRNEQKS